MKKLSYNFYLFSDIPNTLKANSDLIFKVVLFHNLFNYWITDSTADELGNISPLKVSFLLIPVNYVNIP